MAKFVLPPGGGGRRRRPSAGEGDCRVGCVVFARSVPTSSTRVPVRGGPYRPPGRRIDRRRLRWPDRLQRGQRPGPGRQAAALREGLPAAATTAGRSTSTRRCRCSGLGLITGWRGNQTDSAGSSRPAGDQGEMLARTRPRRRGFDGHCGPGRRSGGRRAAVDHHVHGATARETDRAELERLLTESDRPVPPWMSSFDSQVDWLCAGGAPPCSTSSRSPRRSAMSRAAPSSVRPRSRADAARERGRAYLVRPGFTPTLC